MSARHRLPPFRLRLCRLSLRLRLCLRLRPSLSFSALPFPSLLFSYPTFPSLPFPSLPVPCLPFPSLSFPSPSSPPFPFPSPFGLRVVVGYPLGPMLPRRSPLEYSLARPIGFFICLRVPFGCSLGTLGGPMSAQRVPKGTPKMARVRREGVSRKQLFCLRNIHICSAALPLERRKLLFP